METEPVLMDWEGALLQSVLSIVMGSSRTLIKTPFVFFTYVHKANMKFHREGSRDQNSHRLEKEQNSKNHSKVTE